MSDGDWCPNCGDPWEDCNCGLVTDEASGHDRLRAAADVCLQPYAFSGFREPEPFAVALAALLRAVADADRDLTDGIPSCVTIPALALADTILGVPNTGGSESGDVPYKNPADEYPREDGWGFG